MVGYRLGLRVRAMVGYGLGLRVRAREILGPFTPNTNPFVTSAVRNLFD